MKLFTGNNNNNNKEQLNQLVYDLLDYSSSNHQHINNTMLTVIEKIYGHRVSQEDFVYLLKKSPFKNTSRRYKRR